MIDEPLLKLALSIDSSPGAYALLLGSGISREAGIPTGEEIVINLIRKLAAMKNEEPVPDPVTWYKQKFSEDPKYDELINNFGGTQTDRRNILRPYFEPTQEDSEQGLKVPTAAHKAIAALVKMGYIKMILTTNFDKLIEIALQEEEIIPDVISSDDHLQGAIPYIHSKCYLVKLHGDYLDTRIKNTPEELANYSKEMDNFLDGVFDEFGLVVCGWSSLWDTALRKAILRCPNRRFTTFWLSKGEVNEEAEEIINHRKAEVITIDSADQVLTELLEKEKSLRDLNQTHPISKAVAVSTVKRYIVDPKHRIRLHDLVREETERVFRELKSERFNIDGVPSSTEFFQERMRQYESLTERLVSMLAALSYYDEGENAHLITDCLERLTNKPRQSGFVHLIKLQLYPALLVFYATGLCALSTGRFDNLAAILLKPRYHEYYYSDRIYAFEKLNVSEVFGYPANYWIPLPHADSFTPASNYLMDVLKPILCDYLPDDLKYEDMFNLFEYILALTYMDILERSSSPVGRFGWCYKYGDASPIDDFIADGTKLGTEWGLLKAGFFSGSIDRMDKIIRDNDNYLREVTQGWH